MTSREKFNQFLLTIDLARYREKYRHIKLVELNLPKNIQAICHLYQEYWKRRKNFPSFEKFYEIYSQDLSNELEAFRKKTMFSVETFYRGLPARIYRTWASLLTQIQGGYAAEEIYGNQNVIMSAELDYQGIDMKFIHKKEEVNIQIKKESMSKEIRAPWQHIKKNNKIINITYEIPISSPKKKNGEPRKPFTDWQEKWDGKLERLNNGFIIFKPQMFSPEYITIP